MRRRAREARRGEARRRGNAGTGSKLEVDGSMFGFGPAEERREASTIKRAGVGGATGRVEMRKTGATREKKTRAGGAGSTAQQAGAKK